MTENTYILDALRIRRDELEGKRKARAGAPGYESNVQEIATAIEQISAEIARLEGEAE